ncbi:MAG: hypothetical protein PVG78_15135 [Desulfobacterales bacterium]
MQQTKNNSTVWALTLLLAIFLQVAFVFADNNETPSRAAVEVSKAYFQLDPAMAERICEERRMVDDVDVVQQYLDQMQKEADARGFELGMMKKGLYHIETEVLSQSDQEAKVRVSGVLRTRINPVYAWVAGLFHLGQTEPVESVVDLVKEGGKWKACGELFSLPEG